MQTKMKRHAEKAFKDYVIRYIIKNYVMDLGVGLELMT